MKVKVVIHEAEEGGYWAEVPAIPGCATQGETFQELSRNIREALTGCLGCSQDSLEDYELRFQRLPVASTASSF